MMIMMMMTAVGIDWMCRPAKSVRPRRWTKPTKAASPSTVPHCETVYHQHCVTSACHWTCFSGAEDPSV